MDDEAPSSEIEMQAAAAFSGGWQSSFISTSKRNGERGQMEEWHAGT